MKIKFFFITILLVVLNSCKKEVQPTPIATASVVTLQITQQFLDLSKFTEVNYSIYTADFTQSLVNGSVKAPVTTPNQIGRFNYGNYLIRTQSNTGIQREKVFQVIAGEPITVEIKY